MAILGFVLGAGWLQTRAVLPERPWLLIAAALAVVAAFFLARLYSLRGRGKLAAIMPALGLATAMLAGGLCGAGWAARAAQAALAPQLALEDEGRDITLTGTIASLPFRFSQGVRFNFAVERAEGATGPVPPLVVLSWYAAYRAAPLPAAGILPASEGPPPTAAAEVGDVRPGQRWRLRARLQRPHGTANPYDFDYEAWLLEQGLRATGYVRAAPVNSRLDDFVFSVGNVVEATRAVLRARILAALPGKSYAGVIVALVVGDQRGIEQGDWRVFNRTGVGHLISISGLHITMVAGLFALGAFQLWRHSFFTRAQLPLLLPAQKVAALVGAAVALLYVLLAGFGVPAQRTLYMLAVVAAALWLDRLAGVSHVLCAALGLVVLIDPWAVLWPGFWLSFGAVAVILYATVGRTASVAARPRSPSMAARRAGPRREPGAAVDAVNVVDRAAPVDARDRAAPAPPSDAAPGSTVTAPPSAPQPSRRERLWQALRLGAQTQYVVTLGLVPLTMLLFAQISIVSPLANAVAIPLVSLAVTPLALAGSMLPSPLAVPVLGLAHWLVEALAWCLRWCSGLRYAVWAAPVPAPWLACWAMFGTVWLLAPRGWPVRWLGLATWIPLLAAEPSHPAPGRMTVTAFDVGQGMALLIETGGHRLLYDAGPAYTAESNAGERILLPYLRGRGIAALDGMVVSHSDTDHAGGALAVLDGVRVDWLASSLPARHPAVRAARRHVPCAQGQSWTWDGVRFEMLHPAAASYADHALKANARSCTLKITADGGSLLLAGDIEAPQEAALIERAGAMLKADVLLAPHHGSATSSTPDFLRAVAPSWAVFQVGYRNRYHHPNQAVYERYGALRIERLRTDRQGALRFDFGAGPDHEVAVSAWRATHARYWYGR